MKFIRNISVAVLSIFLISNISYANAVEASLSDNQLSTLLEPLDDPSEERPVGDLAPVECINIEDASDIPLYEPSHNNGMRRFAMRRSDFDSVETKDYGRQQLESNTLKSAYDTVLSYLNDVDSGRVDFDSYYKEVKDNEGRYHYEYVLKGIDMTSLVSDANDLKKVVLSVGYDHPEFFWLNASAIVKGPSDNITKQGLVWIPVVFESCCTREKRSQMKEKIENAVDKYMNIIDDNMSDYEKEKVIHDKIINETIYDPNLDHTNENVNDHNIAGVLIDHVAVCEGYAKTMQLLLNKAGINNIYVVGDGKGPNGWEGHAWNQVEINGEYYNLDSTWDNTTGIKHLYFNIPDTKFNEDHKANSPTSRDQYLYNIKSCTESDAYSYPEDADVDSKINVTGTEIGIFTDDNMKAFLNEKLKESLDNNKFDIVLMCENEEQAQKLYECYNRNNSSMVLSLELHNKIVDISGKKPIAVSYGKILEFKFQTKPGKGNEVSNIQIPDSINLNSKNSYFIKANVNPINATNKEVQWSSSNSSIIKVVEGVLIPVANGEATVSCESKDNRNIKSNSCRVHVNIVNKPVESIELSENEIILSDIGETKKIEARVNPDDASNGVLKWTSSNNDIDVDCDGKVTAFINVDSQATITCSAIDGSNVSKTCIVKIRRDNSKKYIDAITMNENTINLNVNESKSMLDNIKTHSDRNNLNSDIDPHNVPLKWTSSDYRIAQVNEDTGEIKGISEGQATITCTANDRVRGNNVAGFTRVSASCTVKVTRNENNVLVSSISVSPERVTLTRTGETKDLRAEIEPSNAANKNVKWTSNNENVATVTENGQVKAVSNGTALITCEAKDGSGVKGQCTVTVNIQGHGQTDIKVNSIEVNPERVTLTRVGEPKGLIASIEPNNAANKNVKWTSDNEGVVTVTENGQIKAVSNGTAVITCEAKDGSGVKGQCTVTVNIQGQDQADIKVNSIEVSPERVTLTRTGETKDLRTTIGPSNATNKNVKWTSDNEGVVTVTENGQVKAVSNGTAVITCEAKDGSGVKGQCTVTVNISELNQSGSKVSSITISPSSTTLTTIGETKKLSAEISPNGAVDKSVKWTSSDTSVVTVTEDGEVKAISNGTAVITCKAQDGSEVEGTSNITVNTSTSNSTDGNINKCNITGTERVGKTLRVQVKDKDGKVIKKGLKYHWYRLDDKDSASGKEVGDDSTYKIKSGDKGDYIKVVVTDSSGNEVEDITSKIKKKEVDHDDDDDDDDDDRKSSSSTVNDGFNNTNNAASVYTSNQNGNWQQINGAWHCMQNNIQNTSGSFNWQMFNGKWYLSDSNNHKLTGWQNVDGAWYLIGPSGDMATGWQTVNGKWYYLKENGQMATGWQKINGVWYYLYSDGSMAKDTSIDGYWINSSGEMAG